MLEIFQKDEVISVKIDVKTSISFSLSSQSVAIGDLEVNYPGEYEKSGILLEVKEYDWKLFYSFRVDGNHIVFIAYDSFSLKEEILSFFGDVDILIIVGSAVSAKIFENIEARIVVPYGAGKQTFLTNLGQHIESVDSYKVKWESAIDHTEFVNLSE